MFKRVFLTFLSGARAESEAAFKASAPLKKMPAPTGFATLLTDSLSIHTYFVLGEVSPPPRVFKVYHSEPAAPDSNLRPLYEPITSSVSHTIFWPWLIMYTVRKKTIQDGENDLLLLFFKKSTDFFLF